MNRHLLYGTFLLFTYRAWFHLHTVESMIPACNECDQWLGARCVHRHTLLLTQFVKDYQIIPQECDCVGNFYRNTEDQRLALGKSGQAIACKPVLGAMPLRSSSIVYSSVLNSRAVWKSVKLCRGQRVTHCTAMRVNMTNTPELKGKLEAYHVACLWVKASTFSWYTYSAMCLLSLHDNWLHLSIWCATLSASMADIFSVGCWQLLHQGTIQPSVLVWPAK